MRTHEQHDNDDPRRGGRPRSFGQDGVEPEDDLRGFDPREFGPRGFGPGGPGFGPGGQFGPGGPFRGRRGGRRGGRGPHRAPRGDVRTAVLLLLSEEPMHGYQLMQTIAERTGGRWAPSPGAIYPTLNQLEDEGLVEISKDGGRKLVTLTEEGRTHVEEHSSSWANPFPTAAEDSGAFDLRGLMHEVNGAVRQVGRAGTDAQVGEAASILAETKRSLYRLLAEDTAAREDGTGDTEA